MLAEKRLIELGFTLDQAIDFITANINQPQTIFNAAEQHGINTRMLSEISGYSKDIVHEYFFNAGYDNPTINTLLNTNLLINSSLGSLESLVAFNAREGALSNASLREKVKPTIDTNYIYDQSFSIVVTPQQSNDGIYSAGELGVENLNNVSATADNLESLFYGSLINTFSALDQTELNQIKTFSRNDDPDGFQFLIQNSLSESPTPIVWGDEQLADLVVSEAVYILDKFWTTNDILGLLDHSYLGIAAN